MRLLHSTTLEFETFEDENHPPYAILSHRWESEEVSFQELCEGSGSLKAGYNKIKRCGERAAEKGWKYFWADTCCIDKSSSEELSEAINSMYIWYRNASVCYAYLSDVSATDSPHPVYPTVSTFGSSKWFTRGWTLQELIAPSDVVFLSKEWELIGRKETLKEYIQEITGIQIRALEGADLGLFSVAERMPWASKRKTTRVEDIAYSLIGIFGVHMPFLYGEKDKSFIRLQEEIMKSSDDQSLFAWENASAPPDEYIGLLANSPEPFAKSGHFSSLGIWSKSDAFSMTNKGLRVELFLVPYIEGEGIYRASLDCFVGSSIDRSPGIYLKRVSGSGNSWNTSSATQFARIQGNKLDVLEADEKASGKYRTVYVRQNHVISYRQSRDFGKVKLFQIRNECVRLRCIYPPGQWNNQTEIFSSTATVGKVGGAFFNQDGKRYMIILGLDEQGVAWIRILPRPSADPHRDWTSYKTTGREISYSKVGIDTSDSRVTIEAEVSPIEIYRTPVYAVTIGAHMALTK
jgi:hypothetical protein